MDAAEAAGDAYATAVTAAAEARADYELAYHKALALSPEKAVSARKEYAEVEANEQHRVWLVKEASEKAQRVNVNVILGLLVASQSQQKFAGKQDGGDW